MKADGEVRATLAQCRDVVGHLRPNDPILFFDFLEKRLKAVRLSNSVDVETYSRVMEEFRKKREVAELNRLQQSVQLRSGSE